MTTETVIVTDNAPATSQEGEASGASVAQAAVEIAEIEANRDVAIAEINAETRLEEVARVEAVWNAQDADSARQREIEECRQSIATLGQQMLEMRTETQEQMQLILSKLTPQEPPPQSQSESASSEVTQANPEEAAPPVEKRAKKKPHRWI